MPATGAGPFPAELLEQLKEQLPEALFATLSGTVATYEKQLDTTRSELQYARLKIQVLEEHLRLRRIAKYGPGSEKLSDLQLQMLEEEPGVSRQEVAAESEREPLPAVAEEKKRKRRPHPGRQTLPAVLPRVEKVIACTPEQCVCGNCGKETVVIGYEVSEVLTVKPAEYYVEVTKREKRACKQCEEQGVVAAPLPARIINKSLVSDEIIIDTIVNKYADHSPLYRQSAILLRDAGVDISRATMCGWVMIHFVDAVKLNRQDAASVRSVELMDELFAVDRKAREAQMDHAARHRLRHEKAASLLGQIREHILATSKTVLPRSAAGKACSYTLALWKKLTCFLDHPQLELSNNLVENSMRPVATGRKNWIHIGSQQAGPRVAAILSVVESCRRFKLPVRDYLAKILPGLADTPIQRVAALTPAAWAARHTPDNL